MPSITVALVVCSMFVIIALSICISCVKYYSSDSKRRLETTEEKYRNLEELMRSKDSEYAMVMKNKDEECKRMSEIINSLTEKQSKCSVDAKISTTKS